MDPTKDIPMENEDSNLSDEIEDLYQAMLILVEENEPLEN